MRVQRQRQTAAHVVAQRHRAQQLRAVGALALAHRQCRRHHAAARVRQRRCVRVIGLVGVRQHPIRQRGMFGGGDELAADHTTDCLVPPNVLMYEIAARPGGRREPETIAAIVSSV